MDLKIYDSYDAISGLDMIDKMIIDQSQLEEHHVLIQLLIQEYLQKFEVYSHPCLLRS